MVYAVGILAAILSFGFIVFIHELGHFLAARWAGIRCPQFAIGFGPKLFSFDRGGTEFSLRLLPLGGYVLMVGEEPNAEGADAWHQQFLECVGEVNFPTTAASVLANVARHDATVEAFLKTLPPQRIYSNLEDLEGNFYAKSTLRKSVTLLGGVSMNYAAAFLLLIGLGFSVGLGGSKVVNLARADGVIDGSPAQKAGIKPGDNLTQVDGVSVLSGSDFVEQMSGKVGQLVSITAQTGKSPPRQLKILPDLLMGGAYIFRQGKTIELVKVEGKNPQIPSGIQLPYTVDRVNGQPLTSLQELRGLGRNAKELTLSGPQGEWVLQAEENFRPRALIGVNLAGVVTLGFEKVATCEVMEVLPGSQAATIGLMPGDMLLSVQGVDVSLGQTSLDACLIDLSRRRSVPVESFKVTVFRKTKSKTLSLNEIPKPTTREWGVRLRPIDARLIIQDSAARLFNIMSFPYDLLKGLLKNTKETLTEIGEGTSGPIGIMRVIYEVSDQGLAALLYLVAILNALIATTNLLPIPALDGARCLFVWWGALRGRALDPQKEARIHFLGLIVLLTLVVLVSYRDVVNWVNHVPLMK